jgi:hypothetical protein
VTVHSVPDSVANLARPGPGPADRPIAAPLEHCAELPGVDLATIREVAANVEPYLRADGTRIWSLMQLERQLQPEAYGTRRAATSTVDGPWPATRERTPRRSMTFGTTI